jgi:hypothetical protein
MRSASPHLRKCNLNDRTVAQATSCSSAIKGVLTAPQAPSSSGKVSGFHIEGTRQEAAREPTAKRTAEKYREEALTLEKALETEADASIRARYTFFLAESWRAAGEKEKALQAYLRRAELGSWSQEVALSLYHAAALKEALGYQDTDIIGTYLDAYEVEPSRAEALHGLMQYCRLSKKFHLGYLVGKHAITIPEPVGSPFVDTRVYDYGLLEEFSVAAYHSGHYKDCVEALKKLLAGGKIPDSARTRLRKNATIAEERMKGSVSAATHGAEFAA